MLVNRLGGDAEEVGNLSDGEALIEEGEDSLRGGVVSHG